MSLRDLIAKPLRLDIGGHPLVFACEQDFAFCVDSRIGVPALRLGELAARPVVELQAESLNIHSLELRLGGIVEDYDRHGLSCIAAVAQIDPMVFSKEYDWRSIFAQLTQMPPRQDGFMRLALASYLRYLGARRHVIQLLVEAARGEQFAPERDTVSYVANRSVVLELDPELRRLPQGKAVTLRLARSGQLLIRLARHSFSLVHNRDWALVADNGKRYVLHEGVNSVGRSRDNDVAIDAGFSNVSRKHLLVQPLGADAVIVTDLSSYGTYIPPAAIAS